MCIHTHISIYICIYTHIYMYMYIYIILYTVSCYITGSAGCLSCQITLKYCNLGIPCSLMIVIPEQTNKQTHS